MLLETERYVSCSSYDWQYTFITQRHYRLSAHQIEAGRA